MKRESVGDTDGCGGASQGKTRGGTDGLMWPSKLVHRRFTNIPLADSRTGATRGRTCQWRGAVLGDRDRAGPRAPGGGLWPPASGRSASLASVLS
jgi:hypothetical protein